MPALRTLHQRVLANIDEMQSRKERLVQEHEHNLLRHFRSKLYEVGAPLRFFLWSLPFAERSLFLSSALLNHCKRCPCHLIAMCSTDDASCLSIQMEEAIKKQDEDEDDEDAPRALLEKVTVTARVSVSCLACIHACVD